MEVISTTAIVPSAAEASNEVALVAAAAALLPIPAKQSQICTRIFAADIDSAEKGTTPTTIIPLELERSSAPKTGEDLAPPMNEAEKRPEQTSAPSKCVNRYGEFHTTVNGVIEELADQETSGEN
jgi:hypothetical protein